MNSAIQPKPTAAHWLAGARPRTLPAAISPVVAGSGIAYFEGGFSPQRALLALVVSIALQVGVNYANDYSDGIRGTDADRVGPLRLVGSGLARPGAVKAAAFASFGLAALAGGLLVILSQQWWLLAVGVACILAAWFYTGGKHPYGYAGLGELFVFIFFGLVAVCGTVFIQVGRVGVSSLLGAIAIGLIACAILVANNLRDIHGDLDSGKRTLATRIGAPATRNLYVAFLIIAAGCVIGLASITTWWALLGLLFAPLLVRPALRVLAQAAGSALIGVLKATGMAELVLALGLAVGLMIGA